jgi:8-oxo-dGTP pyrophosphatase MutT (NUDIX family)
MSSLPIRDAISAGGVVFRRGPRRGVEVILCGRTAEKLWVLPKGTPDEGEALLQTATREVREETGLEVSPGPKIGTIQYWFTAGGVRYRKQVHHWLFEPTGGDVADHDHEFDTVSWVPLDEALRLLTYENERRMLTDAAALLEAQE